MSDLKEWMNPLVPADTRVQIADGEIERLRVCLSKANEQTEHFEREWYLRGDELEQLRAELAASREREARVQWQPIETAPRDGSYLLVSNGHGVWVARFKDVYQSGWKPTCPWQSMMLNHDHIPRAKQNGSPTHWMPPPGSPAALAEGAQG